MRDRKAITVTYKNYRGETSVRSIVPKAIKFEKTEYHEEQWILYAFDEDKKAVRGFALEDIIFMKEEDDDSV